MRSAGERVWKQKRTGLRSTSEEIHAFRVGEDSGRMEADSQGQRCVRKSDMCSIDKNICITSSDLCKLLVSLRS